VDGKYETDKFQGMYMALATKTPIQIHKYFKTAALLHGDADLFTLLDDWHVNGDSDKFSKSKILHLKQFTKLSGLQKKMVMEKYSKAEKMR